MYHLLHKANDGQDGSKRSSEISDCCSKVDTEVGSEVLYLARGCWRGLMRAWVRGYMRCKRCVERLGKS